MNESKLHCRIYDENEGNNFEDHRSPIFRDISRLKHSFSFRKLQGKTQLYPSIESDFFRNRLTHSIEVAQIAKSIAFKAIDSKFTASNPIGCRPDADVCEFAGLAHDLGHPPFGHQGEEALNRLMQYSGGFEGNAQTLRILTNLETNGTFEDQASYSGLNLTMATLSSIVKYDNLIISKENPPELLNFTQYPESEPIKGYYASDFETISQIKKNLELSNDSYSLYTLECSIMDLADDISYSVYDLQDAFYAGFENIYEFSFPSDVLLEGIHNKFLKSLSKKPFLNLKNVITEKEQELFLSLQEKIEEFKFIVIKTVLAFLNLDIEMSAVSFNKRYSDIRINDVEFKAFSSLLTRFLMKGVRFRYMDPDRYTSPVAYLAPLQKAVLEYLKNFTYHSQIEGDRISLPAFRGKEIVTTIFESIYKDPNILPLPVRAVYESASTQSKRMRSICDFIAGMTDRYAIEFYGRLKSEDPATIFKPL